MLRSFRHLSVASLCAMAVVAGLMIGQPPALGFDVESSEISAATTAAGDHLTYVAAATPCVVWDTRPSKGGTGAIAAENTRNFDVSATEDAEGADTGCGIPSDATAAMVNIVAVDSAGVGVLKVWPADTSEPAEGGVVNYESGLINSNAVAMAVSGSTQEVSVKARFHATDTRGVLLGWFVSADDLYADAMTNVVNVDASGTATENGSTLESTVESISDASSSNPYLVRIGPGTYNLDGATLDLPDYVSLQGSGQASTEIRSQGTGDTSSFATLELGVASEVRHLTVHVTESTAGTYHVAAIRVGSGNDDVLLDRITATATSLGDARGIVAGGVTGLRIGDSTVEVEGSGGPIAVYLANSTVTVDDLRATATGTDGGEYGMWASSNAILELADSRVEGSTHGLQVSHSATATVRSSSLVGGTYALNNSATADVASTGLDGGVNNIGTVTCAGVWDGSHTFYASSCP